MVSFTEKGFEGYAADARLATANYIDASAEGYTVAVSSGAPQPASVTHLLKGMGAFGTGENALGLLYSYWGRPGPFDTDNGTSRFYDKSGAVLPLVKKSYGMLPQTATDQNHFIFTNAMCFTPADGKVFFIYHNSTDACYYYKPGSSTYPDKNDPWNSVAWSKVCDGPGIWFGMVAGGGGGGGSWSSNWVAYAGGGGGGGASALGYIDLKAMSGVRALGSASISYVFMQAGSGGNGGTGRNNGSNGTQAELFVVPTSGNDVKVLILNGGGGGACKGDGSGQTGGGGGGGSYIFASDALGSECIYCTGYGGKSGGNYSTSTSTGNDGGSFSTGDHLSLSPFTATQLPKQAVNGGRGIGRPKHAYDTGFYYGGGGGAALLSYRAEMSGGGITAYASGTGGDGGSAKTGSGGEQGQNGSNGAIFIFHIA